MKLFEMQTRSRVKKSRFNLSHSRRMSMRMGELTPTLNLEVVPGDVFTMQMQAMYRLAPLLVPIMENLMVDTHYFFVPNRLSWEGWEDFITKGIGVHPYMKNLNLSEIGSVGESMGYNPGGLYAGELQVNPFPLAAYTLIYDNYFRSQRLSNTQHTPLVDGEQGVEYDNLIASFPLPRLWARDYFTSCLDAPSQGGDVLIPLFGEDGMGIVEVDLSTGNPGKVHQSDDTPFGTPGLLAVASADDGNFINNSTGEGAVYDPNGTLSVDGSEAGTIRQFRWANRLQEFLEKTLTGGERYTEFMETHFGQRSADSRLQRPEFIGSSTQKVVISEVLSTAETVNSSDETVSALGQLGGHGISVGGSRNLTFKVPEHGWIIALTSIRPPTSYMDGIHRSLLRQDRYDYLIPSFADVGEQAVTVKELFLLTDNAEDLDEVFGYIPRYAEYMTQYDTVHGDFKGNLDYWTMGRKFATKPILNHEFLSVKGDPELLDRPFVYQDSLTDNVWCKIFHNITALRPLPKYSNPKL